MPRFFVVVEPHADDAFLSLGAHIERWVKQGERVCIVTMTGFMGRQETRRLMDARRYADAVGADWCSRSLGQSLPKGESIIPLSFVHADHLRVRDVYAQAFRQWYYVDQPYAITQKNGPLLTEFANGMEVISYMKPPARKYRHIPLFRNQAKFFHFNPAEKLRETFELILVK